MGTGLEPEYVAAGDEFDDNSWRYPNTDFEKTMLQVAGCKYYQKEVQAKRVRAIEARPEKYPVKYVERIIEWCRKKNYSRKVITLDVLINTIRNPDNLTKYYNENPTEVVEDRSGYDDYQGW